MQKARYTFSKRRIIGIPQVTKQDAEIKKIERDFESSFFLWRLSLKKVSDRDEGLVSTIFYFMRHRKLIGISLNESIEKNHMTDSEIVSFLEQLYKQ